MNILQLMAKSVELIPRNVELQIVLKIIRGGIAPRGVKLVEIQLHMKC